MTDIDHDVTCQFLIINNTYHGKLTIEINF